MGRRAPVPRYLCQVVKGRPGKPPSTGLRLAQISLHFRMPADGAWSVPSAPKYRDRLMIMLLQCYPPPPQGLFVPTEHRLAAALCLVWLTGLLVSLAVKLSRSQSWSLARRPPNAAGAPARVQANAAGVGTHRSGRLQRRLPMERDFRLCGAHGSWLGGCGFLPRYAPVRRGQAVARAMRQNGAMAWDRLDRFDAVFPVDGGQVLAPKSISAITSLIRTSCGRR